MSIYTTQLRWIVERLQTQAGSQPDDFSACYQYLGLNDYPIFDENYRSLLNDKIIRHFYFREIGFETAAQFAWYLRRTMHENMPYFNQLYSSLNLITDPITNRKYSWSETYELAQGGSTSTTDTERTTSSLNRVENTTDDIDYGKVDTKETEYGRVDTKETEYGRVDTKETEYGRVDTKDTDYGRTDTETDTYGKTSSDTTTTEYGRTQSTVNGGSDESTEGGMHERVIRSDTPMNQISNQGVENLNYATDVTYTDRSATSGTLTEYGGTTDVENGGEDVTTSSGSTGGSDTKRTVSTGTDTVTDTLSGTDTATDTLSGTDTATDTLSGSDTETDTLSGSDERTIDFSRSDAGTGTKSGTAETVRDLDESGTKTHTVSGYDGADPADLLMRWRETFLNVDMQVIASLETLFFGLWM